MKLYDDWRRILRKAWSVRLGLLAGVFSAAEVILPLFVDSMPRHIFAVLSFISVMCAVVARLVAQPKTLGDD